MALLRRQLKTLNVDALVESAGYSVDLKPGAPTTKEASEEMVEWGLGREVSCHKARHFTEIPDIYTFNHFLVVDQKASDALVAAGVEPKSITILNKDNGGVGNPYGRGASEYHECALAIVVALERFMQTLLPAD